MDLPTVGQLGARTVNHAVVCPTHRRPESPDRLFMGVFDSDGDVLPDSLLNRRSGERGAAIPAAEVHADETAAVSEAIYCGPLYHHFGHFLLESLARVWYAQQHPDLPLVWAGASTWERDVALREWQREILDILGVTNTCRIATTATPVERLHLPDIGYRYDDWFHTQHARFLARYHGPDQEESFKIWLSRSLLGKDVRDLNAEPLERRLASSGWTVVHPEQQTVREQLDNLARASVIAGEEGSAFHALMLLDGVRGKKLHVMRRLGGEHRNMSTVGETLGLDQSFHTLRNEVVVKATGRYVTKVSSGPSEVLDILGVPVAPDASDDAGAAAAGTVTVLASQVSADSLLEVGVGRASAIPHCTFARATAVCEEFAFDPRNYATESARFFELSIEQYLASFDDWGGYDVVRVAVPAAGAGLRAVVATLPLASRECLWLLDIPASPEQADHFLLLLKEVLPALVVRTFTHGNSRHAVGRLGGVVTPASSLPIFDSQLNLLAGDLAPLPGPQNDSVEAAIDALSLEARHRQKRVTNPSVVALATENDALRKRVRRLRAEKRRLEEAAGRGWRAAIRRARRAQG